MPLRRANRSVERLAAPNGARSVPSSTPAAASISAPRPLQHALEQERRHEPVRQVPAAVQAELVPGRGDLAQHAGAAPRLGRHHIERRRQPQPVELAQDGRRALGMRPVVECERDRIGAARQTAHHARVAQPPNGGESGRGVDRRTRDGEPG